MTYEIPEILGERWLPIIGYEGLHTVICGGASLISKKSPTKGISYVKNCNFLCGMNRRIRIFRVWL